MIHKIYGVKVINGEKERRYYGEVETINEARKAINSIIGDLDYEYAKEGSDTVLYLERTGEKYQNMLIDPTIQRLPTSDPNYVFGQDQLLQLRGEQEQSH
ncbi:MAG: hypothetical protein FGM62_03715 [Methylobacterium sp.]|nr:hypothetical protein [Methylobacterium sp.]